MLETRVGIVAVIMILGYEKTWARIFKAVGLTIYSAFLRSLKARNRKKNIKASIQRTIGGKKRKRDGKYLKNTQTHIAQMNDKKRARLTGMVLPLQQQRRQRKY